MDNLDEIVKEMESIPTSWQTVVQHIQQRRTRSGELAYRVRWMGEIIPVRSLSVAGGILDYLRSEDKKESRDTAYIMARAHAPR